VCTPSEKYFSDGIRFFLWVFAHAEESEFPVVDMGFRKHSMHGTLINLLDRKKIKVRTDV
jgi:hypothetical protein